MDEPAAPASYLLSRWLFLRLLGVVYLIAFASLAVQVTGLVGEHGLLPARAFLERAHSAYGAQAYQLLPTVFWLGAGDLALRLVAWGGAVLAVLLILGLAPLPILVLLWALYLSLTVVGQDFLSFQWDALLLEAGLLAILWAPFRWLPRGREPPASTVARWLLVFLLFKLMFLSGLTKLLSGDPTWLSATALDYHFETQPLPPWTAWYAHNLPGSVHRAATIVMFAIELGAPWLLLAPARLRRLRLTGCAALILLQLAIAATGNYGFFNALAIVLCIPVLDDDLLRRVLPLRLAEGDGSAWRVVSLAVIAPVFFALSALSFGREIVYTLPGGSRSRPGPGLVRPGDGMGGAVQVLQRLRALSGDDDAAPGDRDRGESRRLRLDRVRIPLQAGSGGPAAGIRGAVPSAARLADVVRRAGSVGERRMAAVARGASPSGHAGSGGAAAPESVPERTASHDPSGGLRLPLHHAGGAAADPCLVGTGAGRVPARAAHRRGTRARAR